MNNARIVYVQHEGITPQAELSVLVAIYRLAISSSHARKKAAPKSRLDDAEGSGSECTAEGLYPDHCKCLIVLFDLREPSGTTELHRQRAVWAEYSDIEALDEHHFVLLIRPGSALEAAA
jgi:hypothetical protein